MQFVDALNKILNQRLCLNKITPFIKVIVISDAGVDDLLMLLQILSSSFYKVVGIVAVQGNTTCFQAVQNTLSICELLGKSDIDVYAGSNYNEFVTLPETQTAIYGDNALNSLVLAPAQHMKLKPQKGVDFVCDSLKNDKYLLISTASLTELASIMARLTEHDSNALKNIIAISMMGGVINQTQEANWPIHGQRFSEANVASDSVASQTVFAICADHQVPIFLAPLDLTQSILASKSDITKIQNIKNTAGLLAVKLIENVSAHYQRRYHQGPDQHYRQPLHDMHAVSCLLHPELYQGNWVAITVTDKLAPQQMKITDYSQGNVYLLDMHYMYREQYFINFADDLAQFTPERSPEKITFQ